MSVMASFTVMPDEASSRQEQCSHQYDDSLAYRWRIIYRFNDLEGATTYRNQLTAALW